MYKQFKNLFPTNISQAARVLFGERSLRPILLKMLPIADISDPSSSQPFLKEILHPKEIALLNSYKLAKRQAEYLTGRLCAKLTTREYLTKTYKYTLPIKLAEIKIATATNGRPIVDTHIALPQSTMDISISHSGDYGIAVATRPACGIDIQRQDKALLRVKERYCTESEYQMLADILPQEEILVRLNLLWATKEAVKKALSYWQMLGFLDIEVTDLRVELGNYIVFSLSVKQSSQRQLPKKATVIAGMFANYSLAICLINRGINNA